MQQVTTRIMKICFVRVINSAANFAYRVSLGDVVRPSQWQCVGERPRLKDSGRSRDVREYK